MWSLPSQQSLQESDDSGVVEAALGPNELGAWTEVIASATNDASFLYWDVNVDNEVLASNLREFFQLGIGASGVEKPVIPYASGGNLNRNIGGHGRMLIPFQIRKGDRLSVRGWRPASTVGRTRDQQVKLFSSRQEVVPRYLNNGVAYSCGAGASPDLFGPTLTLGTTLGSWVEIASATERQHEALYLTVMRENEYSEGVNGYVEVAVGPSGSEQKIGTLYLTKANSSYAEIGYESPRLLPVSVPAGSRLSIRGLSSLGPADVLVAIVGY